MSGSIFEFINRSGVFFCDHALRMLLQSSILIAALLIIDLLIRKRIKAVLRYSIWLLVFIKLITPTTLSLPTGIGYWLGDLLPDKSVSQETIKQNKSEITTGTFSSIQLSPRTLPQIENPEHKIIEPAVYVPETIIEKPKIIIPAAPIIKIQGVLFLGWIVGELVLFALLLQRTFFVRRIVAQSRTAPNKLHDILTESCQIVGINKNIDLRISQSLQSPAACGLLKPKIIFPNALLKCFSSEKLRTTMLHELAHIKRKDILVNSLQTLLQIFYFYNPMLWITNIIVRRIREQAVDETVLVYLGEKADTYSSTLVDIAEIAFSKPSLGMNMIGVVESKKALTQRIRHILSRPFPKKVKLGISGLALIIITAFVLIPMAKAERTNSEKTYTTNELLEKIIESENKLHDMEAHCDIYEIHKDDNKLLWTIDWGYENQKEYRIEYNLKDNDKPDIEEINAFDGNVLMSLYYDNNIDNYSVFIHEYNSIFHHILSPKIMLGYSLNYQDLGSFSGLISKARESQVLEEKEQIYGRSCTILEAIGIGVGEKEQESWYDVRAWIDTERDFRPLKIEMYRSYGQDKEYAGNKRWSIIESRIDNIKLKQIDGVWFPVSGERQTFHITDYLPPEGMTRKEFQKAYEDSNLTSKQKKELQTPIIEPSTDKRKIEITNIKINKGIAAEKFTIPLLDGYVVNDGFLDKHYVVGEPSEIEVFLSDDEIITQLQNLSPAELVKLIHTEKLGQNNRKWMAAIYCLAQIGSPAIPAIADELKKTDTPIKLSKLALTLRAIGDPNAVPDLCDALERCINASDYGLGDVHSDSKLEMFYRRYQIKPEDPGLGLGRPVREITISLERLTGHSEGHDHFNAYDAEGNQLGGYILTPEIVDRQKENYHKVAQQWRTWFQENKDTIEPSPAPAKIPVNPDIKRASGGILASSEGSTISFAIIPNIGDSSKLPNISFEQKQKYIDDIEHESPYIGSLRGDSYQWSATMQGFSSLDGLTSCTYKNRTYILTCARAQYVMMPEVENKRLWSLEEASPAIDAQGKPAIYIRFNEQGAERFAELTQANIGNRMAINMDSYGIVSVPYIMTALNRELIISGEFTEDQVSEMVDRLQKGMVLEKIRPELLQAAEGIKKEDLPSMSPGDFVKNLLIAGFAGNAEKLEWFMPDKDSKYRISVDDFAQIDSGGKIEIMHSYSDGQNALVITTEMKAKDESDTEENGQFVLFLEKHEGIWKIIEADITNLRSAQWFIDHFKEKHLHWEPVGPDAKSETESDKSNSSLWLPEDFDWNNLIAQQIDSMKQENIKQTIEHLGNTDDAAISYIILTSDIESKAEKQIKSLKNSLRTRKLYAIGQKNPELIIPDLRQIHKDSFAKWPEAYKQYEEDYKTNKLDSPIKREMTRVARTCLLTTYLLAESGDYNYLPELSKQFRMHHIWPPPATPSPVSTALTFYAMHRLVSSYPRESLSEKAIKALDEYLESAKGYLPTPEIFETTAHIGSNSDNIAELNLVEGSASIAMPLYPTKFTNGTDMEDHNGMISEQLSDLFNKLDVFVQIVYPPAEISSTTPAANAIVEAAFISPDPGHFMAVLPNGVSVELLGVSKHPSNGKQWWKPDGSKLDKAPYDKLEPTTEADEDSKLRGFAIYFRGQDLEDAKIGLDKIHGQVQPIYEYRLNQDLMVIRTAFSKTKEYTSIPIGVSSGQWKTRAVFNGKQEITSSLLDGSVTFQKAAQENGKTTISIIVGGVFLNQEGRYLCDNRIIAKDNKGNILAGKTTLLAIRGFIGFYSYETELPLEQITLFEYQTRPYYWIDFENVALDPHEKTNVNIRVSTAAANYNSENVVQMEQRSAKTNPVWISFLPASPIRSLADYQHSQRIESLTSENIETCELEIRSASDNKRIARFNYDNYPMNGPRWGCKLNKKQIQEIGAIEDGTYFAAFYVNGIRCSNVAEITIDSNTDLTNKPVLQLVPLSLGTKQGLPNLGIIATGPNPTDPELMQIAIYYPNLFVDGIERKPKAIIWAGTDRVIQTGSQGAAIVDLQNYSPAISLNERHEVWAKLGDYQSATIAIPAANTIDKNWDEITEKFYPTKPPVVMLEGTITGPDGKPAVYNVSINRNNENGVDTTSDQDGKYEFTNLPPEGDYVLFCRPPLLGQPGFLVSDIEIREGQKKIMNFDFTNKYTFSGTVSYEDGSPAVNVDVMATWGDSKNEFMNYDKTDEKGNYSISSPFEIASYVGIGALPGYPNQKQPYYRNLKAGRDDVNFVLKK